MIVERDDGRIAAHDTAGYFTGAEDLSPLDRWACAQARGRVLELG
ncbi:hypothetical protein [Streptomonospora wellingtoniae]|uniref:Uncharacterized protein n=1 Tax=Streptomonospora wellingtoniae TaxID=3075544 RepID=A0ABU2KQ02_9ACTN|nr:hypothetical protein [Streptomonospora sp. DSM 45055]MDT0301355.1 hypothetical protein [Streptomonospora sp. DSM 45055]